MHFGMNREDRRGVFCRTAIALVVYEVDARAACAAGASWWEKAQCFFDNGCGIYKVVGEMGMLLQEMWSCRQSRS